MYLSHTDVSLSLKIIKILEKKRFHLFLEKGEGNKREGEKYQCVVVSHVAPTGDLACNPGMCPAWESNQ